MGLRQGGLNRGVPSIDGKFTSVAEAARELGIATQFSLMNKLLSKFAHPTAMLTLANSESIEPLKESVFANGCLLFVGAFTALEEMAKAGV